MKLLKLSSLSITLLILTCHGALAESNDDVQPSEQPPVLGPVSESEVNSQLKALGMPRMKTIEICSCEAVNETGSFNDSMNRGMNALPREENVFRRISIQVEVDSPQESDSKAKCASIASGCGHTIQ